MFVVPRSRALMGASASLKVGAEWLAVTGSSGKFPGWRIEL